MVIHVTLCYLIKDNKVLLQRKSKELFGGEKWNGPGGKIKENENPLECVKREISEEIGVKVSNLKNYGLLKFFKADELFMVCNVFVTNEFEGEPKSGIEGVVKWFNFNNMPFKEMWPSDKIWFPLILQGKKIEGNFHYDKDLKEVLDYKINVI